MEAMIAVLRPKCDISSLVGKPQFSMFDILLDGGRLLSTNILLDVEPAHVLCYHLYIKTGGDACGLKGKRAIYVPPTTNDAGALYCIPVDKKDQFNGTQGTENMSFQSLDKWFEYVLSNTFTSSAWCPLATCLQNWIIEKYSIPGALALLFSSSSDDRLVFISFLCYYIRHRFEKLTNIFDRFKWSISNPAFVENNLQFNFKSPNSLQSKYNQRDTLEHMQSCDRCDITKSNPLFGSNLSFKYKVDKIVINKHWGLNKTDASTISTIPGKQNTFEPSFISDSAGRKFLKQSYPLHLFVSDGNIEGVKECLRMGCSVLQNNGYFETPLHLSTEKGHVEILELMLDKTNCDVNSLNHLGQSLLHVAAINGKPHVSEVLLRRGADLNITDSYGKTAMDYCGDESSPDLQACYKLFRWHIEQPVGTIDIHLMDSTCVRLGLVTQADTTIGQLHKQMMKELKLPDNCANLFSIWICSRNLQLQLKPDHKPIQQLNNWKRTIVGKLTDQPPALEDPELYWKRNVLLSLKDENDVTNPTAINLLYLEAYHNYIKSLYLCMYHDVVLLAGILKQLFFGDYKEPCDHFARKPQLYESLVPSHMILAHNRSKLVQHINEQYKAYSEKCVNKQVAVHQTHFLKICRLLTTYACAFFTGYKCSKNRLKTPIFLGVNDVGIHIITVSPREMVKSFLYKDIEWEFEQLENWQELRIRTKSIKRMTYTYLTKQAALINNLMKKLYELISNPKPTHAN